MKTPSMSEAEIVHWIAFLRDVKGWKWVNIGRALGFKTPNQMAYNKARGTSRIVGGEAIRCSRQLQAILAGRILEDGTLADDPQPMTGTTRMTYDLKAGRLGWITPKLEAQAPTLPSWKDAFAKARYWCPKGLRDDHP